MENRFCGRSISTFAESKDLVLESSGASHVDKAVRILWNVIQKIWWWVGCAICIRYYLHNNTYSFALFLCYFIEPFVY